MGANVLLCCPAVNYLFSSQRVGRLGSGHLLSEGLLVVGLVQREAAPFLPISRRFLADRDLARARPPLTPPRLLRATASAFFPLLNSDLGIVLRYDLAEH